MSLAGLSLEMHIFFTLRQSPRTLISPVPSERSSQTWTRWEGLGP
jgi:hypothetical protein